MSKGKAGGGGQPSPSVPEGYRRVMCNSHVTHDGKAYAIGEDIVLPEAQALALIAVGAVSEVPDDGER